MKLVRKYERDSQAAIFTCVNLQHEVYRDTIGYLIHPRINASLPANACIADIGTGIGIWLRDVASRSPSSWMFTGFDISADQFPKDDDGIVKYEILDILQPITMNLRHKLDVVHFRLLINGLTGSDWMTTAGNALELLRPGGWLQ